MSDFKLTAYKKPSKKNKRAKRLFTHIGFYDNPSKDFTPDIIKINGAGYYKLDDINDLDMAFYKPL